MSYDLYFHKKNKEKFSREEFTEYFQSRPHYKVESNGQALYDNDETGVYFIMEHNEVESLEPTEDPSEFSPANLSLNYLRPHIFALEAGPEIQSFVSAFDLSITDLQNDGNRTSVYDKEAFIRGWNVGNKFAFDSFGKNNPEIKERTFPSDEIEKCWRWNFQKNDLQTRLGENIFVPQISFHLLDGKVRSLIVWSEAIPTAFPEVDTVIIFRQSLAPAKFFSGKKNDFSIKAFSEITPLLGKVINDRNGISYQELVSEEKAREWVKKLPSSVEKPAPISIDKVLDSELLM